MHSASFITNITKQYLGTLWSRRIKINSQFGQVKTWWLFGRNAFLEIKGTVLRNYFLSISCITTDFHRMLALSNQLHLSYTRHYTRLFFHQLCPFSSDWSPVTEKLEINSVTCLWGFTCKHCLLPFHNSHISNPKSDKTASNTYTHAYIPMIKQANPT